MHTYLFIFHLIIADQTVELNSGISLCGNSGQPRCSNHRKICPSQLMPAMQKTINSATAVTTHQFILPICNYQLQRCFFVVRCLF